MLDIHYKLRTQPGRMRCSNCGPGELRWCRREHGSLKVLWQLKGGNHGISLHLIYETGQRPQSQITTLGLVLGQKVESGKQVTESFNVPEGFFNWMVLENPNQRNRSLARCAWPLKGISMKYARIEIPSQECNAGTWK